MPFGTAHFSTCPGGFEVFFLRVCTPVHSARITQGWRWNIIMQIPGLCLRPTELDLWGDEAQESALQPAHQPDFIKRRITDVEEDKGLIP